MNTPEPPVLVPPGSPSPRAKMNWWLFFIALFTPTLVTIIVIALGSTKGDTAPTCAFVGGVASGITCGVLLGRRLGSTTGARVALGFVFAAVMSAACVIMNCFGCLASGYQFIM